MLANGLRQLGIGRAAEELEALVFGQVAGLLALRGWFRVLAFGCRIRGLTALALAVVFRCVRSARLLILQRLRQRSASHVKHLHAGWLWLRFLMRASNLWPLASSSFGVEAMRIAHLKMASS